MERNRPPLVVFDLVTGSGMLLWALLYVGLLAASGRDAPRDGLYAVWIGSAGAVFLISAWRRSLDRRGLEWIVAVLLALWWIADLVA